MYDVRIVTAQDSLEPIYRFLTAQLHHFYRRPFDSPKNEEFRHIHRTHTPARRQCFVGAYYDGEVIGTGSLEIHRPDRVAPPVKSLHTSGYISRVYVDENHQSNGIGQMIYDMLEQTACSWGYTSLYLETHEFLNKGLRFWEKQGFHMYARMNDEWQCIWMVKPTLTNKSTRR